MRERVVRDKKTCIFYDEERATQVEWDEAEVGWVDNVTNGCIA